MSLFSVIALFSFAKIYYVRLVATIGITKSGLDLKKKTNSTWQDQRSLRLGPTQSMCWGRFAAYHFNLCTVNQILPDHPTTCRAIGSKNARVKKIGGLFGRRIMAGRSGYPKISGRVVRVSGISDFQKCYPKLDGEKKMDLARIRPPPSITDPRHTKNE